MKSEIHIIAEAILANTMVLKMLVEKLPDAAKADIAAKVEQITPMTTPVTTVPAEHSPVTVPYITQPNTPAPVVAAAPAPVVEAPAPVVQAPADYTSLPTPKKCPFVDQKGLITYVMDAYKQMGQQKGAAIQGVLDAVGIKNINEVKPEMYQALYDGVEAIRNV